MTVLQHYYTSYVSKVSGSSGFQVKAMSPGIPADMQTLITRLIAYRMPPDADPYAIETHPIALRYLYKRPDASLLLCCQSCGSDESGRPGNFFAHTLVLPSETFTDVPPILYYKSAFWKAYDPLPRTQLEVLSRFDAEPALDSAMIWEFLAQPNRRQQFYSLLCAIIQFEQTRRRIIISDSIDNVALWIAAVSMMLPPPYRPTLSFTTYHHDPYQSPFVLTGAREGFAQNASYEKYLSYFLLDTKENKMSQVGDSAYARFVTEEISASHYEATLLPFFTDVVHNIPIVEGINGQLDAITLSVRRRSFFHADDGLNQSEDGAPGREAKAFEQVPSPDQELQRSSSRPMAPKRSENGIRKLAKGIQSLFKK